MYADEIDIIRTKSPVNKIKLDNQMGFEAEVKTIENSPQKLISKIHKKIVIEKWSMRSRV